MRRHQLRLRRLPGGADGAVSCLTKRLQLAGARTASASAVAGAAATARVAVFGLDERVARS